MSSLIKTTLASTQQIDASQDKTHPRLWWAYLVFWKSLRFTLET